MLSETANLAGEWSLESLRVWCVGGKCVNVSDQCRLKLTHCVLGGGFEGEESERALLEACVSKLAVGRTPHSDKDSFLRMPKDARAAEDVGHAGDQHYGSDDKARALQLKMGLLQDSDISASSGLLASTDNNSITLQVALEGRSRYALQVCHVPRPQASRGEIVKSLRCILHAGQAS
jgi:hypothetical protein